MGFKHLVRDQEVDGSNPFAPTTSFKDNLQRRKVPTTSWLCAKRSVVPMSSPNDLHFPLQIGVKWREAATTFSSFCSPRSPNRTGFGMGRLKPRPTFSPYSSWYWTSSRKASVARVHLVVLMGHPVSRNANVHLSWKGSHIQKLFSSVSSASLGLSDAINSNVPHPGQHLFFRKANSHRHFGHW